jgi:chromosome segregation ATPase
MSESQQLLELKNTRAWLEEESRSLKEERKKLEENIKVLEEKIAIEALKKTNSAERDFISQLKAKLSELEQKLKEITATLASNETSHENTPENVVVLTPEITTLGVFNRQFQDKNKEIKKHRLF